MRKVTFFIWISMSHARLFTCVQQCQFMVNVSLTNAREIILVIHCLKTVSNIDLILILIAYYIVYYIEKHLLPEHINRTYYYQLFDIKLGSNDSIPPFLYAWGGVYSNHKKIKTNQEKIKNILILFKYIVFLISDYIYCKTNQLILSSTCFHI